MRWGILDFLTFTKSFQRCEAPSPIGIRATHHTPFQFQSTNMCGAYACTCHYIYTDHFSFSLPVSYTRFPIPTHSPLSLSLSSPQQQFMIKWTSDVSSWLYDEIFLIYFRTRKNTSILGEWSLVSLWFNFAHVTCQPFLSRWQRQTTTWRAIFAIHKTTMTKKFNEYERKTWEPNDCACICACLHLFVPLFQLKGNK